MKDDTRSTIIRYRNLPQLLLKGRENLLQHFRPIITHFGLTEPQWRILRAVSEHGELEPREIMDICQILSPSLAGILSRMEELDLISRHRMLKDKRRLLVRLTPKSTPLVNELSALIQAQYIELEKVYGAELLQETIHVVDKLLKQDASLVNSILPKRSGNQNH